jgi:hypothetical protein
LALASWLERIKKHDDLTVKAVRDAFKVVHERRDAAPIELAWVV